MARQTKRRRKKTPADLVRDFARDFRRGISAAAFVVWCELLRQEFGCIKPAKARLDALDSVGELLTDYLSSLPQMATDKETLARRIDQLAGTVERALSE